jgi:hypothetical protein
MGLALERKPREFTFDRAFKARLIILACSDAPEGHRRRTVRLLDDKVIELSVLKVQCLDQKNQCYLRIGSKFMKEEEMI